MRDMMDEGRRRVVIENVQPRVECGDFPIKRVVGERVEVTADIYADGHDSVAAGLLYRKSAETRWMTAPMEHVGNDRWTAHFTPEEIGVYSYSVEGWVDHFLSWQKGLGKKIDAGQDVAVEMQVGAGLVQEGSERARDSDRARLSELAAFLMNEKDMEEASHVALGRELSGLMERYPDRRLSTRFPLELPLVVDRQKALFSTWYEHFPRSCTGEYEAHGTFRDCENLLPKIAGMGFDVLYLPPIHPIGRTHRKGKNSAGQAGPEEPGSPWAIGSEEGGHKSINPRLGTLEDFRQLTARAAEHSIEVALDLAFQCSPDHPYVKEHPEWFKRRPDGTVQYAENPPKKYEDIYPLNFETDRWKELWEELKSVVLFWIGNGVRIFRVDNPHTKPFLFWEWLITEVKKDCPECIFLAEAFTRPKVMYHLAGAGFTQSYTYFTWRNSKQELTQYMNELTQTRRREYFRPNFWPNTPDILPEYLQYGGRPAFTIRLILAATLSSNYGIYGPAFELLVNDPLPGKEEYLDSEKYEVKRWNWDQPGNLRSFIARLNTIRREHPALQTTWNLRFYETDNDYILFFGKTSEDRSETILVAVNLDPFHVQSGWLEVPLDELGIVPGQPYLCHDLLSDDKYIWQGGRNFIELNPQILPAHIFRLRTRMRRETDFDYFM